MTSCDLPFWFGDCILSVWSKKGQKRPIFFGFFRCFLPLFFADFCTQKTHFLIRSKKNAVFSPKKRQFFQKKRRFFCVKMSDFENQIVTKAIFSLENALKKSIFLAK